MDEPNESTEAGQTGDSKAAKKAAKAAKKAAKGAAKAAKKGAPAPAAPVSSPVLPAASASPTASAPATPPASSPASSPRDVEQPAAPPPDGMTPAERSALAAERNVALQRRRVIISAIGVALALFTALITWLSFRASYERSAAPPQEAVETRPTYTAPPTPTPENEVE